MTLTIPTHMSARTLSRSDSAPQPRSLRRPMGLKVPSIYGESYDARQAREHAMKSVWTLGFGGFIDGRYPSRSRCRRTRERRCLESSSAWS
jgi:hypothetical protein